MKPLQLYAFGRIAFGVASLTAPAITGATLAGPGGALPDAQAFLRGMGAREIGLGLGLGTAGAAAAAGAGALASLAR
ncbi:hypothetical protein [Mycobacterium sp. OAE908]|uniref:hypothetical protein n=1 Tax=Mycobacterium sp. OAE908 TaxID=2817899 RepID=UPI001AE33E3E